MSSKVTLLATGSVTLAALLLTGCGSSSVRSTSDGRVDVVASTNVWGDVAEQIGGSAVRVTSVISDPDQDPHSFEASTTTALEISRAKVLIENGGGYDDFVAKMVTSTRSKATVLDAVTISGKSAPAGGELNEHVWYDVPTVQKVAGRIAAELGKVDPQHATTYDKNAAAFDARLATLTAKEAELRKAYQGEPIGITEPVPLYLTDSIGLVNKTPAKFSEAIEEGNDVSPAVLQQTLDLYSRKEVKALVYNEQTTGVITQKVQAAAKTAGIGIVPVTETLPKGQTYVNWMQQNLDRLKGALDKG